MASSSWGKRIKNLVKQPPFLIVKDLLNRIPGRPFRIARFFLLSLSAPATIAVRGFGVVREGTHADVAGMCLLEDKRELFNNRFNEGESCVVAVHAGLIVGYEWFSDKAFHLEERFKYRLEIPKDSIYAYDAFIKREYRLRGIWVLFQKYILDQLRILGRKRIITMVDYGNDASLKAHLRFGYVKTRAVQYVRILNKIFFSEKTYLPEFINSGKAMFRWVI